MNLKIFTPETFNEIEKYWHELESGEDMTAFQLYDWYKILNALYFKEKVKNIFRFWIYILVYENDVPIMIAPVQIVKYGYKYKYIGIRSGFYFAGRQGYSDYLNFIYTDFEEKAVDLIINYLINTYKFNFFSFERLHEDSKLYKYIINKFTITNETHTYCAELTLPNSFEEYKSKLTKSVRQNIRTAINRQNRDGLNLTHEMIYSVNPESIIDLYTIRNDRIKEKIYKSEFNKPFYVKIYNFINKYYKILINAKHDIIKINCNPWCFLVKDKDKIAGFFFGIKDKRNVHYAILAGVSKEYTWYSPTFSHFYLFISEMYDNSILPISKFDFTRGNESYKKDIGSKEKFISNIEFYI